MKYNIYITFLTIYNVFSAVLFSSKNENFNVKLVISSVIVQT